MFSCSFLLLTEFMDFNFDKGEQTCVCDDCHLLSMVSHFKQKDLLEEKKCNSIKIID